MITYRRGAYALLVSTDRAMRRPRYVERVTGLAPRFFMYVIRHDCLNAQPGVIGI